MTKRFSDCAGATRRCVVTCRPCPTWCHLMTPATFEDVKGITHEPIFRDTVGAWSGVVIAEAMLLAEKSYVDLRFSACLATATYAIGRSTALWRKVLVDDAIGRLDSANRLCRGRSVSQRTESRMARVRSSLRPIWACLAALTRFLERGPSLQLRQVWDRLVGRQSCPPLITQQAAVLPRAGRPRDRMPRRWHAISCSIPRRAWRRGPAPEPAPVCGGRPARCTALTLRSGDTAGCGECAR